MSRILIVDDEPTICWALREHLRDEGHEVEIASSAEEGLRAAAAQKPDLVLLDIRLPGIDGLTALAKYKELDGTVPAVIMTAFGNLDTAVRAVAGGAFDYLVKPFDLDQVTAVVTRALDATSSEPAAPVLGALSEETLIGSSPAMQAVFKKIALVAPTDAPVLITGESGTGKELVARAIHSHSARRAGPFVPVCLAALSPSLIERELFGHVRGSFTGATHDREGLLELSSGGTVLLDEIGDVPAALQVKLLRAIEHREVTPVGDALPRVTDIRVVAATNRPLGELMAAGQFREDLFFRLSVFQMHLPPLRERREDIPALAHHFLRQARIPGGVQGELSAAVIDELLARPWLGNARELRNAIEHAAILARGRGIQPNHLPAPYEPATPPTNASPPMGSQLFDWAQRIAMAAQSPEEAHVYERYLELTEPHVLRAVMETCDNNRARAAQVLGMHRATLRQKLTRYEIA